MSEQLDAVKARIRELQGEKKAAIQAQINANQELPEGAIDLEFSGDGRVYQTDDGELHYAGPSYATSNREDVLKILETGDAEEVAKSSFDKQTLAENPVLAPAATAMQGPMGGFVDEAAGAMFGDKAAAGVNALVGAHERERPITSAATQMAGSVARDVGLASAFTPAKFASWLAKGGIAGKGVKGAAVGAPIGAAEMATSAAGRAEEGEKIGAAVDGLGTGAVVGGALGALSPLIAIGSQWGVKGVMHVSNLIKKSGIEKTAEQLGVSKDAVVRISQAIDADGGPEELYKRLAEQGEFGTIGSAGGGNVKAALDRAATSPGAAMTAITEATTRQNVGANKVVMDNLDLVLNKPRFKSSIEAQAKLEDGGEMSRLYKASAREPVDATTKTGKNVLKAIKRMSKDDVKLAVKEAEEQMRFDEIAFKPTKFTKNGVMKGDLTVGHLDQIKKSFQETAYSDANFDMLTGKFKNATGRKAARNATLIRQVSIDHSPLYKMALSKAAKKAGQESSYEMGLNMMRPTWSKENSFTAISRMDDSEKAHAIQGVRNYFDHKLGEAKSVISGTTAETADAAGDIKNLNTIFRELSSPNVRYKLQQLIGGKETTELLNSVKSAGIVANLRMQVAVGSKTGLRASAGEFDDAILNPNMAGKIARGQHLQSAEAATQALTGKTQEFDQLRKAGFYADIAEVLATRTGPEAKKALLVFKNRDVAKALSKSESNLVVKALTATGIIAPFEAVKIGEQTNE